MISHSPAQVSAVVLDIRIYDAGDISPHMQVVFIHALQFVLEKYGATLLHDDSQQLIAAFNIPHLIPFPSYLALKCAAEMHQVFNALCREIATSPIKLAIGIARGLVEQETFRGEGVQLASFIAQQTASGEMTVSDTVYEEIKVVADQFNLVAHEQIMHPESLQNISVYRFVLPDDNQPVTRHLSAIANIGQVTFQVLIAEDDPSLRSLFAKVLKNAGINVHIAVNGHDVMAQLTQSLPDVLVLDLGMPGISGEDVILYVRQHPRRKPVKIVVVTGNHLAAQSSIANDVDLLLIKPISPRDLVNFVQRFMK